MTGLYLILLLVSIGCELTLDRRFRLFWWRDARAATITMLLGLAFFLIWDLLGIQLGIFFTGDTEFLLGVELAADVPVEEPVFLILLIQSAMTVHGLLEVWRRR